MAAALNQILPWICGGFALLLILALFRRPLRCLGRVAVRTAVGLGVLFLLRLVGHLIGVSLGVNLYNALVVGVLGAPGFGLLLLFNWMLL